MKRFFALAAVLLVRAAVSGLAQNSASDEAGRVLGLENAWNHTIEAKDTKALDMIRCRYFHCR
jgi:hypothetical protein